MTLSDLKLSGDHVLRHHPGLHFLLISTIISSDTCSQGNVTLVHLVKMKDRSVKEGV